MASSCHRCARRVKISLLFAGFSDGHRYPTSARPPDHFFVLALSRFGKALQNIADILLNIGYLANFDVFSKIFVVAFVLRTICFTKIIFFAMSSTKNGKNAKSRGHASLHEARSELAGLGNSAQGIEKATKSASLRGGAAASFPVDQATASDAVYSTSYSSPPPPPATPYPGSSSSAMQRPPLPKDAPPRSSTADTAVGDSERGADALSVKDRSRSPLSRSPDARAEWKALQERQDMMHSSLIQSIQGLAQSLSTQQQQQHFEYLGAHGPLSG